MTVATLPRTIELANAFFSSGHTGRLPLIETPQSTGRKCPSHWTYCSGIEPSRPLTSRYCWIFASVARGLSAEIALHRVGADPDRDEHEEGDDQQRRDRPHQSPNDESAASLHSRCDECERGAGRSAGPTHRALRWIDGRSRQVSSTSTTGSPVTSVGRLVVAFTGGVPHAGQQLERSRPDVPRRVGALGERVEALGPLLGTDDDLAVAARLPLAQMFWNAR